MHQYYFDIIADDWEVGSRTQNLLNRVWDYRILPRCCAVI